MTEVPVLMFERDALSSTDSTHPPAPSLICTKPVLWKVLSKSLHSLYAAGEVLLITKKKGALFPLFYANKMVIITIGCLFNFLTVGYSLRNILCMVIQESCLVNNCLTYRKSLLKLLY